MNRVETSAEERAEDLTPLTYGESSQLVACTPGIAATAAFALGTWVATYVRANYGFEPGVDQANSVAPGADLTVGELVHELRKSTTN
jgi:hypothetical protein